MFPNLSNLALHPSIGTPTSFGEPKETFLFEFFELYRTEFKKESAETVYLRDNYKMLHVYFLNVTQPPPPPPPPRPPLTPPLTPPRTPPQSSRSGDADANTPIVDDPNTPQDRPSDKYESRLMQQIDRLQKDISWQAIAFKQKFSPLYTALLHKLNEFHKYHRLPPPGQIPPRQVSM